MVLSASPPHDESRQNSWLDDIRLELRLSTRGLLILVDDAQPERLRELVIALLPEHPELIVETDVQSVYSVPEGSVMVLVPHTRDAEWLNQQRPVFARRELKVILWCDAITTEELRTKAVDFFDWISHVHECPPGGVFLHEVYRLRAEFLARRRIIHWSSKGSLNAHLAAAFPGRKVVHVYKPDFTHLVDIFREAKTAWVVVEDDKREVVDLALHESGRRGRVVLVLTMSLRVLRPHVQRTFLYLHRHQDAWPHDRHNLCRLIALADFDDDAVALLSVAQGKGISRIDIEAILCNTNEPRAALARLVQAQVPPYLVSRPNGTKTKVEELVYTALKHARHDNLRVAEAGARHAVTLTAAPEWQTKVWRAKALQAVGLVDLRLGRFREAEASLRAARQMMENQTTADAGELGMDLVDALMRQGRYAEALPIAEHAVNILRADHPDWHYPELPECNRRKQLLGAAEKLVANLQKLLARSEGSA